MRVQITLDLTMRGVGDERPADADEVKEYFAMSVVPEDVEDGIVSFYTNHSEIRVLES